MKLILSLFLLLSTALPAFAAEESVYDRVMASKTLRCGHVIWEPYITRDLTTNRLSGITYDYLNEVAKRNGLTIDWSSEVNIDQIIPAVENNKIDAFCVPCSPVPEWEERLDFAGSFGNLPYFTYVAAGKDWTQEKLKTARFAVVDGYIPSTITPKAWPEAKITSLAQTTSMAELYDQLKFGKADAVVNEHLTADVYMKNNPGIIARFGDKPLLLKEMFFPLKKNEPNWAAYFSKIFDPNLPENRTLLNELMKKYNVTADTLLFETTKKPGE